MRRLVPLAVVCAGALTGICLAIAWTSRGVE